MSTFFNKCIVEKLETQKCPIDKTFSELKPLEKFELFVEWIKHQWLTYTIGLIFVSLIALFGIGVYVDITKNIEFDIFKNLNTWVGFILGLIATIFSIISMFLSFYNIEKAKESEDKQKEISDKILKDIQEALSKTNEIISKQESTLLSTLNNLFHQMEKIENKINISSSGQNSSIIKF